MYLYVYVYIYIYTNMYTCTYMHICIFICMHISYRTFFWLILCDFNRRTVRFYNWRAVPSYRLQRT